VTMLVLIAVALMAGWAVVAGALMGDGRGSL